MGLKLGLKLLQKLGNHQGWHGTKIRYLSEILSTIKYKIFGVVSCFLPIHRVFWMRFEIELAILRFSVRLPLLITFLNIRTVLMEHIFKDFSVIEFLKSFSKTSQKSKKTPTITEIRPIKTTIFCPKKRQNTR